MRTEQDKPFFTVKKYSPKTGNERILRMCFNNKAMSLVNSSEIVITADDEIRIALPSMSSKKTYKITSHKKNGTTCFVCEYPENHVGKYEIVGEDENGFIIDKVNNNG